MNMTTKQRKCYDTFYPADHANATMLTHKALFASVTVTLLRKEFAGAVKGDRRCESALCNRLGTIRRNVPKMSLLDSDVKKCVVEATAWLRAVNRTINYADPDPSRWITRRDGAPRW